MISKSTIAAMVLVAMGLASPAFGQVPPRYYYDYAPGGYYQGYAAGPYAYPYGQPVPFDWAPYGNGGWPPGPASVDYNIHTPPNH